MSQSPPPPPVVGQPLPAGRRAYPEDPGRSLGIIGLVLAIVASLVGLIISIVAYRKSKAAGFANGIALAGIIVGAVTTALGLVSMVAILALLPTMTSP